MAYTKTVWVASTAPGISATNLNNLETQYDEGITYTHAQKSSSTPLVATSIGAVGTSTGFAKGDHQHPYGTKTMFSASVASTTLLAYSIAAPAITNTAYYNGGTIVKRAGVYTIEMQREAGSAVTSYLTINGAAGANGVLVTTTCVACGNITVAVGDVLATRLSAAPTGAGVFYTNFYNTDGWW